MDEMRATAGKAFRGGLSVVELFDVLPHNRAADRWPEDIRWSKTVGYCPRRTLPASFSRGTWEACAVSMLYRSRSNDRASAI